MSHQLMIDKSQFASPQAYDDFYAVQLRFLRGSTFAASVHARLVAADLTTAVSPTWLRRHVKIGLRPDGRMDITIPVHQFDVSVVQEVLQSIVAEITVTPDMLESQLADAIAALRAVELQLEQVLNDLQQTAATLPSAPELTRVDSDRRQKWQSLRKELLEMSMDGSRARSAAKEELLAEQLDYIQRKLNDDPGDSKHDDDVGAKFRQQVESLVSLKVKRNELQTEVTYLQTRLKDGIQIAEID